jgi:hypothetical protein
MGDITVVSTPVMERSTVSFALSFFDETSLAVAPNSVYWSLSDVAGSWVNSRQNVGISNPTASLYLTLSSMDLQVSSNCQMETESRRLLVSGNYNSNRGTGLSLNHLIKFDVTNISMI